MVCSASRWCCCRCSSSTLRGGGRTLVARSTIAAMSSCSFFCFAHGPPITRLHICGRNAAQLARPRRDPPGVDRGPLVASLFLQSERTNPALQSRKNSAATSHPPIACGFCSHAARFPRPCAVTPLAAGVCSFHARASWASVAPAPPASRRFMPLATAFQIGRFSVGPTARRSLTGIDSLYVP